MPTGPAHERRTGSRRATGRVPLQSMFVDGKLVNLSREGFAIETRQGLRVGETYDFFLASDLGPVPFRGEVRWCVLKATQRRPDGDVAPLFRAGIHRREGAKQTPKHTGFIDFSVPAA